MFEEEFMDSFNFDALPLLLLLFFAEEPRVPSTVCKGGGVVIVNTLIANIA